MPLPVTQAAEEEPELSDEEAGAILDDERKAPIRYDWSVLDEPELSDEEAGALLDLDMPESPNVLQAFAGQGLDALSSIAGGIGKTIDIMGGTEPATAGGARPLPAYAAGFDYSKGPQIGEELTGGLEAGLRGASQAVYPEETRGRGGLPEQVAGIAGGVLASAPFAALGTAPGMIAYGLQSGIPLYYEIKAKTGDEEAAGWGLVFGSAIGQLERFGAEKYAASIIKKLTTGKIGKATENFVLRASMGGAGGALSETGTEIAQQGLSDLLHEELTGEDLDNWNRIKELVPAVLLTGGAFGAIDSAIARVDPAQIRGEPQRPSGELKPAEAPPAPAEGAPQTQPEVVQAPTSEPEAETVGGAIFGKEFETEQKRVAKGRQEELRKTITMSTSELEQLHEVRKKEISEEEERLGVKEIGRKIDRLQRSERPEAAEELARLEEGLSVEQKRAVYGIGDTRLQPEEIRETLRIVADVESAGSQGELTSVLRYRMGELSGIAERVQHGEKPSEMDLTEAEVRALAVLRAAEARAGEAGWDFAKIQENAAREYAGRFPDPDDAAFMLRGFLKKGTPSEQKAPAPKLLAAPAEAPKAAENPTPAAGKEPSGITQLYGGAPPVPGTEVSGSKVKSFVMGQLRSRGHTPEEAREAIEGARGFRSAEGLEVRVRSKELRRAASKAYGKNWLQTHGEALDAALKSPEAMAALPSDIQRPLTAIREHIDRLSRRMIATGAARGPMVDIIQGNLGEYATRVYRAFTDPKWQDKVPPEVSNRLFSLWKSWSTPLDPAARKALRKQARERTPEGRAARAELGTRRHVEGKTDAEIRGQMSALLEHARETVDNPFAHIAKGKLGSKDLSILRHRKSMPAELRDFLGEIKNPLASYAASVSKLANLVSQHEAFWTIRKRGLGKWIFEEPSETHKAQISSENNPGLQPLSGLYTTPEIKKALMAADPQAEHLVTKALLKANAWIKVGKIVYSPLQVVRQLLGNPTQNIRNGHGWALLNPTIVKKAFSTDLEEGKRLARLGITGESVAVDELKQLQAIQKRTPEEEAAFRASGWEAVKDVHGIVQKVYQFPDDLQRKIGFYAEEKMLLDEGMSPHEAEKQAAAFVKDHYPTWSRIVPVLKYLRRQPLFGTYYSFKAEQYRNWGSLLVTLKKELSDPKTRARGMKRAVGALSSTAIAPAAATTWAMLQGTDREDDELKREFTPDWDKKNQLLFKGSDLKGKYYDFSDVDPGTQFTDPIARVVAGDDLGEVVSDFVEQERSTFVGFSPILDLLADVVTIKATGKNRKGAYVDDMDSYIVKKLAPGALDMYMRGKKTGFGQEVAAVASGGRWYDYDVEKSIGIETQVFSSKISDNTRAMHRQMRESDKEEAKKLYAVAEEERKELFENLSRKVRAATQLGMNRRKIEKMLDAVLSEEMTNAILRGGYIKYDERAYQEEKKKAGR